MKVEHPIEIERGSEAKALPDWQALAGEPARLEQRHPARLGWWLLLAGFGGFLAWAALAPLDNGINMPGTVMVAGERQAVESLGGGVVETLSVGEGDRVSAGQPLVHFDPTRAVSALGDIDGQLEVLRAREARLIAERDGLDGVVAPPGLSSEGDSAFELQRALFDSRRAALEGELAGIQASLAGQRAALAGIESSLTARRSQRAVLEQQWRNLSGLADEGYVPRNRLLELDRQRSQLDGEIASDLGALGQTREQINELELRARSRRDVFQQEVRGDLADVRGQLDQLVQRRAAAEFELAHQVVRAPVDGTVVGLSLHTVGGVVQPGARLMEIVPLERPLTVEGQLAVESIDKVVAGLPVELAFTAFDRSSTPRLEGEVTLVSADRLEDERSGMPFYRVRVEVGPEQLARLDGRMLRAGMPVEVFVRTGERSLLNYLFKPLLDRARTAWGDA